MAKMKILILSDLHNEFTVFKPVKTEADVIVLAGDIDNCDYAANGARVDCNPRRYVTSLRAEITEFDPSKVVEV